MTTFLLPSEHPRLRIQRRREDGEGVQNSVAICVQFRITADNRDGGQRQNRTADTGARRRALLASASCDGERRAATPVGRGSPRPCAIEMMARDEPPTRGRGAAHCSRQRAAAASAERLRRLAGNPSDLVLSRWWPETESNRRHGDFQSPALPTELPGQRDTALMGDRRARN